MAALSNSLTSLHLSSGSSLKQPQQCIGFTKLPLDANRARKVQLSSSTRSVAVQASYGDGGRSNSGGVFIGGFVLGGLIVGTLACVYAPQISKRIIGADRKELMRKLPNFLYDEEKEVEKTRKILAEKIAQLNSAIDGASHLLKYDSMLGTFKAEVKIVDNETISVDGKPIKVVSNRDPLKLPWAEMGIDIVIEGTGVFVDGPGAGKHIQAGAKKVIITAPAKGAYIPTYVVGVNEEGYGHNVADIVSNASCTTNCLAPFVKVLDEEFCIVKGTMTTTHSYTGDQRLLDASHRDLRRARAAALNIVPTSTGAAKAVSLVLPQLKGKLNGIALRVPTPNVSVVDLVINVAKKGLTAEDVNGAFRKAADGPLKGILAVCDIPLVSVDFRCTDVSCTIDSSLTMVMGDDMVKVVAWYDNEWGYSQRVVDLAHLVASKWPGTPVQGSGDPLEDFCKDNPAEEECKVYEA